MNVGSGARYNMLSAKNFVRAAHCRVACIRRLDILSLYEINLRKLSGN